MGVLPIRKTAPDTVALTTFYNKNFIQRSEKVANDYGGWLTNNIIKAGIDGNNLTIKNLRFANVFNQERRLPRDYTAVSKRLSRFVAGGVQFSFNINEADALFGEVTVRELAEQKLVPVGQSKDGVYAMDPFNVIYLYSKKGLEAKGRLAELLEFPVDKAPHELTELSMMGKAIPLGLIFSYYYGLEAALREFKVMYRVAEAGERVSKDEGSLIIPCRDGKYVLTFSDQEQALMFNGLRPYLKLTKGFTVEDMNRQDVYLNLIQKDGLTVRYLSALDDMDALYVDPISERILKKMGEPTDFRGLLRRANEMLTYDQHLDETDIAEQHIYGHQRIAGAVYGQLVKAIREANNKPSAKKKIVLQGNAVWQAISQDPAVMPASDANPIHSIKEADVVTFGGTGGRSRRSMVKHTRKFGKNALGVISGDTVDNGDVGITEYLSCNPIFEDLDGMLRDEDRSKLTTTQYLSFPSMLAPGVLFDDPKRQNFIGIQHGSGMAANGYVVSPLRTTFEKLVAHRTGSTQANVAEESGKVIEMDEHGITVEYNTKPKTTRSYPIGRSFGRHEGGVFPHQLKTTLKLGSKFEKGDVLTFNEKFFEPDPANPSQVLWKAGVIANTVLLEGVDTLEDSSAISPWLSEQLKTQVSQVKNITVNFSQAIHGLVKPGAKLTPEDVLCLIEDEVTAGVQFSDKSIETLRKLAAHAPTAGATCVVDRIDVFYNGDTEDMSETVAAVATWGDRQRRKEAKRSQMPMADNGRVDSTLRIDGNPVELGTMVIRFYLTRDMPAIGGDKAVFSNQMKTTFRRVMIGKNETVTGIPIHAIFGKKSADDRMVLSLYLSGTTIKVSQLMSEHAIAMLNE